MMQKTHFSPFLISPLMATVWLIFILPARLVNAGGGVVLRPPFNGTYRVTSYFDHQNPNYVGDNWIWIYNGERVASSLPNHTGEPYPYDGHDGWDWSMGTGTDILAAAAGTVVLSTDNWGCYGHTIIINHGNSYYTQYSHLNQRLVNVGNQVTTGQHIGESGNTSHIDPQRCPVLAHLHFGVRHGGFDDDLYAIDPFGWRGTQRDPLFNYNGKESSCLWGGVPGNEISCADTIVEDDGAGWYQYPISDNSCANSVNSWARCDAGNGFRQHWTYVANPAEFWATWDPPLQHFGYYQVRAFIPTDNSTTDNARYQFSDGSIANVNQNNPNPFWASLGVRPLWPWWSVWLTDYTGEASGSRRIVADALKFSASIMYLPKVRNLNQSWLSSIVIRNNSASSAQVAVNYYNADGGWIAYQTATIGGAGTVTKTPPSGFTGSAVVVSSEDVAVMLEDQHTDGRAYAYNGLAAADSRNPDWGQVGTDIHLPLLMKSYYGWSTSVTILNTGSASAYYDFDCFGPTGVTYHVAQTSLGVQASTTFDEQGSSDCPSVGSGRITSDQPLAVMVTEKAAGITSSHNGVSAGATTVSLPLIMANFYDYRTSIAVQNLGSAPANLTVTYYPAQGYSTRTPDTISNLPSRALATLVQMGGQWGTEPWIGAARITANQPVAAVVNQASTGRQMSYNSFLAGSGVIVLPAVRNNAGGWTSSAQVQNLDNTRAYIIVRVNGIPHDAGSIDPYKSITLVPLPGIDPTKEGPATIECTSGQRIVAVVDTTKSSAGDWAKDYSGLNR